MQKTNHTYLMSNSPSDPSPDAMTTKPPIVILGAGLAGLSAAQKLLNRGVPTILYDKSPSPLTTPRHSYGLTIARSKTWSRIRPFIPDKDIRRSCVVAPDGPYDPRSRTVRVSRKSLEAALSKGLDIRWSKKANSIKILPPLENASRQIHITFDDGEELTTASLIAADGIHSMVRRSALLSVEPKILNFVVFRGKRTVPLEMWNKFKPFMNPSEDEASYITPSHQTLVLKIDEVDASKVSISYTYSRPARTSGDEDPLHKPGRGLDHAKVIPAELFTEIDSMLAGDLPSPFKEFFEVEKVKADKLLHWLMRTLNTPPSSLHFLETQGVWLIGEAAKAQPIILGHGANKAVGSGLNLGKFLSMDKKEQKAGKKFYYSALDSPDPDKIEHNQIDMELFHGIKQQKGKGAML